MGPQWNVGQRSMGWPNGNFNGSNMSLNIQSHGYAPNDHQMWNPWMQPQYPNPMMHNGIPPRSRNHSRAASPTLSVRSRRSTMSSRNRHKYVPKDLTDDEDSDIENFTDDSRSRGRRSDVRNRTRRNTEQMDFDYRDKEVVSRMQKMKEKSKYIRERRSGSLTNWPTTKDRDSRSLTPSDDDDFKANSTKFRKSSLTSPVQQSKRLLSDSASEKDVPEKQKEEKALPKIIKNVKNDSASEREIVKEKSLKANNLVKTKKKSDTESESEPEVSPTPVEKKPESEKRPLKVVNNPASASKTSSILTEKSNGKIEKKSTPVAIEKKLAQPEITVKEKQIVQQSTAASKLEPTIKKEVLKEAAKQTAKNWECEHCTFVNEATTTICTICCKTRVDVLQDLPKTEDDIDINEINDSILQSENEAKQKGRTRKISFLPGTKAH